MSDNRRLIPMSVKHLDGDNWIISVDGEESYKVKGDLDSIKKACRRIKAKDGENNNKCRSAKVGTYASMISDSDNNEHKINVWKSKVPHSAEEFKKLMEKKGMILTKNYLIEGNIISKGSVIRLKEDKIGFLPTDVWEKVKTIDDEEKRFEFVKTKLGDEFTDDEIKDFLNQHKNDINKKSLKEDKIGFLPTDIWNKAKEISDEAERFEYVKKELDDEFTDDEIKDFLNKYKKELN